MTDAEQIKRRYAVGLLNRADDRLEVAITPGQIAVVAKLVDLITADITAMIEAYVSQLDGLPAAEVGVRGMKDLIAEGHYRGMQLHAATAPASSSASVGQQGRAA